GLPDQLDKLDPETGEVLDTFPYDGNSFAFSSDALYLVGYRQPGVNTLTKLDKDVLEVVAEEEIGPWWGWPAVEGDRVYITGAQSTSHQVEVRSAETLEHLETIDTSAAGATTAVFGFVAPGVLLLNHTSYLNTLTGEVVADAFPV